MADPKPKDTLPIRDQVISEIPVQRFIDHYEVANPEVIAALEKYPSLAYLLGRVTDKPQTRDIRFDGVERDVRFLTEGSGMFNLEPTDDAIRWKGIFNHAIGTSRQVFVVARMLKNITPEQRQALESSGYDFTEFDTFDPELLRDFMFISHVSRRSWDERNWYNLDDEVHPPGSPGETTAQFLADKNAPKVFQELIRVEQHAEHLAKVENDRHVFPNIVDNILTWSDWTYGQKPTSLTDRFEQIRETRPDLVTTGVLGILET